MPVNTSYAYEIRIEGLLPEHWSGWFENLEIHYPSEAETTLRGVVTDQAALLGMLTRMHALNLSLISVNRLPE